MNNVDLHIHSIYSDDGQYLPKELIKRAKERKIALMSITDHDRAMANTEAISIAKQYDISYLTGIEVSCQYQNTDLHVLGYGIDHTNPLWEKRYRAVMSDYNSLFYEIVDKLNAYLGVEINAQALIDQAGDKMVNGETICHFLLSDPKNKENPLLKPYFQGGERSDMPLVHFYWDLMAQGRPAYVPLNNITPLSEAIKMISSTGGFAVLAHPGQNLAGKEDLLEGIIKEGVKGIEVYTTYHDEVQIAYYKEKALELGCLITGGSDFHGDIKPSIEIGEHHGQLVSDDFLKELVDRKLI